MQIPKKSTLTDYVMKSDTNYSHCRQNVKDSKAEIWEYFQQMLKHNILRLRIILA